MPQEELMELCIHLAKYKKENKDLLHYLLFESQDEENYITGIKQEVEELFSSVQLRNLYFAKKGIRKILRLINKYIKYSGKPETTILLLGHFCRQLDALKIDYQLSTALLNLREAQLKKIHKAISSLHEDLQYDYSKELNTLPGFIKN